eukprot:GHVP01009251.1.p1 GENE.GHVP01009251.1~~GHVP01009251.1.p1  ORF type:complete len:616 (+),score=107.59 GHVP01009251.1:214-1848(+)
MHTDFLDILQKYKTVRDSKDVVDMPSIVPLDQLNKNFKQLKDSLEFLTDEYERGDLVEKFVEMNFDRRNLGPLPYIPKDWTENPETYEKIADKKTREWALEVHKKWRTLFRKPNENNICKGGTTSFLWTKGDYFVVPGGRFREFFYWDTYWTIKGLNASCMKKSIETQLQNFYSLVDTYGYVPNGSRVYFTTRSQPPFLTLMVDFYMQENLTPSERIEYIRNNISYLEKEYRFWMEKRCVDISKEDQSYTLNVYNSTMHQPRPESYTEDYETVRKFSTKKTDRETIFKNISASCESGWDFSSRWMGRENTLEEQETSEIIPVDLQGILLRVEKKLSEMYLDIGNKEKYNKYLQAAERRKEAIYIFLWDDQSFIWRDFNIVRKEFQRVGNYSSSLYPLYFGAFAPEYYEMTESEFAKKIISDFLPSLLSKGGIKASNIVSGQQWDAPNTWATDQDLFVSFLREKKYYDDNALKKLAINIAQRWITTTYLGWKNTGGLLFEKYNGDFVGMCGGGGEYLVQDGFGWTNGVILHFLVIYKDELVIPEE